MTYQEACALRAGHLTHKSGMGAWICTEGDRKVGETAMNQMLAVFGSLKKENKHKPFEDGVQAIYSSYEKAVGLGIEVNVPFSGAKCQVREIGKQAEAMTARMLASEKAEAIQPTIKTKEEEDKSSAWKYVGLAALAFIGGGIVISRIGKGAAK